jgi:putative addiction module killer protein
MEYEIQTYETADGKRPFSEWLKNLKDIQVKTKIRIRLDRLAMGNFGECKPVGDSVSELKMDFGPGYRIYFGKIGKTCVLLLSGGIKRTQVNDIKKAKAFFADYKARKD